jgi:predicted PurR-regulated permease PerM
MKFGPGIKLLIIGLLIATLFYIGYLVRTALLLIFISIVFAIIFSPCVTWIQRRRIRSWSPGRGAAILILLAAVLLAITVFLAFAAPPIAHDTQQMSSDVPKNLQSLQQSVRRLPFGPTVADRLNESRIQSWIQAGIKRAFGVVQGLVSGLMALLTLVLLTAYFLLDGRRAFEWAMAMVPAESRARLAETLQKGAERMQRWLYGQMILMLVLGSASAIVFGLLGIRYFYALAVFAGLANFIPILGPIATVVVAVLVAALDSWAKVLGVIIFYMVYQQVENAYLTPRIMRAAVDLPGITVIVALTIGGQLAGLLGAIVAVPTAALIATVMREYLMDHTPSTVMPSRRAA